MASDGLAQSPVLTDVDVEFFLGGAGAHQITTIHQNQIAVITQIRITHGHTGGFAGVILGPSSLTMVLPSSSYPIAHRHCLYPAPGPK